MDHYRIEYTKRFQKEIKKIDKYHQKIIQNYIEKHIDNSINPRLIGKILKGDKAEFIRYRIGDYRLIATIEDDKLLILALSIGHRKDIYKHF
ncbi:Toxin RelG [Yersinia enterocolitica]|uniref:Type II toxin-antitoxin system mRNA interferase toxin, RelE/StbE family n=1 Tax=Proteus terrae subsp. cibarius TaxID=626774 RepID=A0ABX6JWV4_9GAMM|nr:MULTISPECIES: type II toxin-antitoxin system RelE/ParE family toxin [Enterobacterales]MBU5964442.1 type II toxin-antitoxin system RelE/ParE family toxin [Proteus mirabilis]QGW05288.1 type II toxin-antitoxin system RelE/ParE family toxin [Proteus terrae subsp. cibarius]QHD96439.1 type II toxin-antitoxin system mRNA interferase toxin, RelE/StbE family [Proteus terrae subsp. cibarius]QIF92320.1 type II toxin-antitoxin system mRNA interferase toxin, RelE/StbE family [Proteus terrae subsp. cibari